MSSHPDDFVQCDLEFDRSLRLVGEAFARSRILPLALPHGSYVLDRGWISQLTGDAPVALHDRLHGRSPIDLHACRLQDEILAVRKRFVMIIDGRLRPRSIHTYGPAERPPSPLDFVHLACRLRDERTLDEQVYEAPALDDLVGARVASPRHLRCGGAAAA